MISAKGLTKYYKSGKGVLRALDGLTVEIGAGEVFGFIGPNGAGKSTTMKILACLMAPDTGSASVAGFDVGKDADRIRREIGYMPDFLGVYDDLTVSEYLGFFAAAYGIDRRRRAAVIGQVLELTDLTEKRDALVEGLSRGMQQRLGVARVLVHEPKVLLLDEPASGLDPRARIEMRALIQQLGRMGKTLMISSHILSELGEMCTSIGIIERGRLLFAGPMSEALAAVRGAGGGERVVVTLESGSAAAVAEGLSGTPGVARARGERGEGGIETVTVDLERAGGSHHALIDRIAACGGRVGAFRPVEVDLEDAFLKLTTGAVQ